MPTLLYAESRQHRLAHKGILTTPIEAKENTMAIYGIGAKYGSTEDKLPDFINKGFAFIGFENHADAPAVHEAFDSLQIGDILYVKSYPKSGLHIKAVGFVVGKKIPY